MRRKPKMEVSGRRRRASAAHGACLVPGRRTARVDGTDDCAGARAADAARHAGRDGIRTRQHALRARVVDERQRRDEAVST